MSKYDKYKESAFTHEEMQPMIVETDMADMTDIVERLRLIDPTLELRYCEDVTKLHEIGQWCHEAADEIERLREALSAMTELFKVTEASAQWALSEVERLHHALECVVLYWDEWKDAPDDHPTALSLEEVVNICRPHLREKE